MNDKTTRRQLLIAGGVGLSAIAAFVHPDAADAAASKGMTDTEKANVKLMRAFFSDWNTDKLDIDKVVAQYMAPNAPVRWSDDTPVLYGTKAAAIAAKASMPDGSRAVITIHRIFAHGPLVATDRVDVIKVPGKPDAVFDAAGVAIIKDGKIVEYADYIVR
jgi:limonene-1,2-epoxide hydrolase